MTPWVKRLIVANAAVFLLMGLVPPIVQWLWLVPAYALFRPWSLVTYTFLHAGLGHLFFNMLALFFFGPRLEERLGSKNFLILYFFSGLMGGVLSVVTPLVPIIGASGAVYGVLLGFAYYWPRAVIYIWGVLPVEARWLIVAMTALSLWSGFSGAGNVAHFAHLGGFLGGFLYLKWLEHRSPARRFKQQAQPHLQPKRRGSTSQLERWRSIKRDQLHEVNRAELDRILDKINATGLDSLAPEERAFLDRFAEHDGVH